MVDFDGGRGVNFDWNWEGGVVKGCVYSSEYKFLSQDSRVIFRYLSNKFEELREVTITL